MPSYFTDLHTDYYCSLGQEKEYYRILNKLPEGIEILECLQDIIIKPEQAIPFEDERIFTESLLRFSEAEDNYATAGEIFGLASQNEEVSRRLQLERGFTFKYQFKGFSAQHEVECHFKKNVKNFPFRIMAFVGKNGTGKTAVLSEMAKHISGVNPEKIEESVFTPERPPFSRTIVVSYSPFGPFKYPTLQTSSYRYCGILNEKGEPDFPILDKRRKHNINELFSQQLNDLWFRALRTVGLFDNEAAMREVQDDTSLLSILKAWKRMSSGHYYVTLLLTDIVANLTQESLLIIDEPELYLHPNMVSALMRGIEELLISFESYAIVATHSPIVVQEIPGSNVRYFRKINDEPHVSSLDFESFGENLTGIINRVFGQTLEDKNYMKILEKLSRNRSVEEVNALFDNKLGMSALSLVSTIIRELNEEEKQ